MADSTETERRRGANERRRQREDRRNPERVAEDLLPRRDNEKGDRRRKH